VRPFASIDPDEPDYRGRPIRTGSFALPALRVDPCPSHRWRRSRMKPFMWAVIALLWWRADANTLWWKGTGIPSTRPQGAGVLWGDGHQVENTSGDGNRHTRRQSGAELRQATVACCETIAWIKETRDSPGHSW